MEVGLNKVMLIGRLHREPELRYAPNGQAVAAFTVTNTRQWQDATGREHAQTEWFSVVAWGKLAEAVAADLKIDQRIYVEGRLHTRGWPDEAGQMHYRTEIVAHTAFAVSDLASAS
jgi:single-strand DNA-binding protein